MYKHISHMVIKERNFKSDVDLILEYNNKNKKPHASNKCSEFLTW